MTYKDLPIQMTPTILHTLHALDSIITDALSADPPRYYDARRAAEAGTDLLSSYVYPPYDNVPTVYESQQLVLDAYENLEKLLRRDDMTASAESVLVAARESMIRHVEMSFAICKHYSPTAAETPTPVETTPNPPTH